MNKHDWLEVLLNFHREKHGHSLTEKVREELEELAGRLQAAYEEATYG